MNKQWSSIKPMAALIAFAGLMACGASVANGTQSLELGAESPEAVVARISRAAEARDIRELAASIDPQQIGEMAEGLAFISAMIVAFSSMGDGGEAAAEVAAEKMAAIVTRYGLPSMNDEAAHAQAPSLQEALAGLDQMVMINLIAELAEFLETLGDEDEGINSEFLPPFDGELTDLVVDGASATASIGSESIAFVQVDGRWYARMPEPPESVSSGSADSGFWADWDDRNQIGSDDAVELTTPASRVDMLDSNGRRWYRFSATESGTLSIATRASGDNDGDLVIEAFVDETFDQWVARSDADRDGDPANESIEFGLQAGQILHIKVAQWGAQQNALSYQFDASFSPGEVAAFSLDSDWSVFQTSSDPDHSEAVASALALEVGQTRQARLADDETHWYTITAPAAGTLSLTTRGTGTNDGDLRVEAFLGSSLTNSVDYSDMDILGDFSHELVRTRLNGGEQMVVRVWQWSRGEEFVTYELSTEFSAD